MKKIIGIVIVAAIFAIPAFLFLTQNKNKAAYSSEGIQAIVNQGDLEFAAERDYFFYQPPLPTSNPEKIEVVDIFWYGCPSCYNLHDDLELWHKKLGSDVLFIRKPVAVRRDWLNHAKIWLTAKMLGVEEKLHHKVFNAIHKDRLQLNNIESITEFFVKNGIDELKFKQVFNSAEINKQIQALNQQMAQYKINVTPSLIINGRYLIPGKDDDEKMLRIADYLIAKERLAEQTN